MSDSMKQLDQEVIASLRSMAQESRSPSEMVRELKRCLGKETHIITLLKYFRQAFCLSLSDVKPIAALSRTDQREVEDEALLDDLLLPALLKHRRDWESVNQ